MRLFEALVEAGAPTGESGVAPPWNHKPYADALPIAVLSCIDPRLNALLPRALRVPEGEIVWLRSPGNAITGPDCQLTRALVWGCAIKQVREVAIIGHTDCKARQLPTRELIDRLEALGVESSRLPDDPRAYFGLFASEEQNVRQGVEHLRRNGLLGPRLPIHGLMIDTDTGRLSWVVNGYDRGKGARIGSV